MGRVAQNPASKELQRSYKFFREHAGGIVGRSAETAMLLARAELLAASLEWSVDWEPDEEEYQSGGEWDQPSEVYVAVLRDENGDVLGSLGGIGDPDRAYARVVEAELALESAHEQGLL